MPGLNDEARAIILTILETGCRQAEIHDLSSNAIVLDHDIPHIRIDNEVGGREVKNMPSVREIPLVGVALEAMKRHAGGFSRYRGKASFSATVNKYFRGHNLLSSGYTIGGIRHSFESRMKGAGIHNDDRAEMMGHSVNTARNRERYGDAMPLSRRREILEMIRFKMPGE